MKGRLEVASRIRRLREDVGLSQSAFGARIGLDNQSHVSKIESGEVQPSIEVLGNISTLFNVTIDFILKGCLATSSPSSENKFYVGYNVHLNNNAGRDALRYLNKCIESIQKLDEQSTAYRNNAFPVDQAPRKDNNPICPDELTELEQKEKKIAELETELEQKEKKIAELEKELADLRNQSINQ